MHSDPVARPLGRAAVLLALVAAGVAAPAPLRAACTSPACPDTAAIENVRALVAGACDCAGATKHAAYVRCAGDIVKAAVRDGTLPRGCRKTVARCEARSTCGLRHAVICCAARKGRVKSRIARGRARCPRTSCDEPMPLVDACTVAGACARPLRGVNSFRSVQRVLSTSCALPSCHSTFARQGGLVLDDEEVSYASLVDRPAVHPEAASAHLLRVKRGAPAESFLVQKLRGLGPGDPMPQAGGALPAPVIRMVEDWIARGARSTAEECGGTYGGAGAGDGSVRSVCDDGAPPTTEYVWRPNPALDAPAPGKGLQIHAPPAPLDAGQEWELCYAFRPDWRQLAAAAGLPAGQLPVIRSETFQTHPGVHHLHLAGYIGQYPERWPVGRYFPCGGARCDNAADCPPDSDTALLPVGGTQVGGARYEIRYPNGIGIPALSPTMVLIADLHFTNPFQPPQPIYGETWINLDFYGPGEFKALVDGIFASNQDDLLVEPFETKTIRHVWQPRSVLGGGPIGVLVFQLYGHMHKRGKVFQVDYVRGGTCTPSGRPCGRDDDCVCKRWETGCQAGETCVRRPGAEDTTIYYSTRWDEARIVDFPPPYFQVNADEGLRWSCTHRNGVPGDPAQPPKRCQEGCLACGWDAASRTCVFTRGVEIGVDAAPRVYREGDPMPLVFGPLSDDDMCFMFGYVIKQSDLAKLP